MKNNGNMKIRMLAICKNEERIMPFFMKHYLPWVDQIVIADGGSTDSSVKIAKAMGGNKVIIARFDDGKTLDDSKLMRIRNFEWIEGSEGFDWQIVCDMDEFIYHENILPVLEKMLADGVDVATVHGYEMYSHNFPRYESTITEQVAFGRRNAQWLDKSVIFNLHGVKLMNYQIGCHTASPVAIYDQVKIKYSEEPLTLLHYRNLGYDYTVGKARYSNARLSQKNIDNKWGFHYVDIAKQTEMDFILQCNQTERVVKKDRSYLRSQHPFVYQEMFEWNVYQVSQEDLRYKNILDIGGHMGFFTMQSHDLGANRIIAVEASPLNYSELVRNTADIENFKAINAACTDRTGDVISIQLNDDTGSNKIGVSNGSNFAMVSTISLEDAVSLFGNDTTPIVLKMDVEGAEHVILNGTSDNVLRKFETILMEIHGSEFTGNPEYTVDSLISRIMRAGYQITWRGKYFTEYPGKDRVHVPEDHLIIVKFKRM